VVGAIIGTIVVVLVAALLLRWNWIRRRFSRSSKGKHQALADDDQTDTASTIRSSRMRERHVEAEANDAASHRRTASRHNNNANTANRDSTATTVDRNTSVRSIMTLPAYRQSAGNNEQVLGVEGERDGIDVVVELPTAEEDEERRDDEMEALYQIRLARRRQIAEREERRRERNEARERHDYHALDELRVRAREAAANNTEEISTMREELEQIKQKRQRAVSSVSYADLGVARADGTRLRANSNESERVGLLSDAASIAPSTIAPSLAHQRNRSTSSVLSVETGLSDRPTPSGLGIGGSSYSIVSRPRSRTSSRPHTPRPGSQRAGSSPEIIEPEMGLADADMPPHSPPGYDEVSLDDMTPRHSRSTSPYPDPPPNYSGLTEAREARLSAHVADMTAEAATGDETHPEAPGRRSGAIPQLPSLRLNRLPQIVVEPSSAVSNDGSRR
jgi:hypothetical protein